MRFSQSYTLLSAVLATTLVSARPAPQGGGITGCSPDGKAFITAAGNVPCAAGLVCKPELVTQGVNPCTWPSGGGPNPSVTTPGQQPVNSLVPSAPTVLKSPGPARPAPEGKRLVVYWSVFDNAMVEPTAEQMKGVTHLIFAFVDMKMMNSFLNAVPDVTALKAKPHFKDVKFTAAFGGWDLDEDFRPKTIDDTSRKAFADEMVKFVNQYKLDGIDLDWEYPGGNGAKYKTTRPADPDEGNRFAVFIETLRGKLGEDKLISVAVPAKEQDVAMGYNNKTVPYMNAFVDEWNVMSYDFLNRRDGQSVTGHHAGAKVMENARVLWEGLGIDPAKINLGVPFYSKYFKVDGECSEAQPLGCKLAVMENADGSDAGVGLSGAIRLDYSLNMRNVAPAEISYNSIKNGTAKIFHDAEAHSSAWYDTTTHWFWSFLTKEDVAAACTQFKPKVGGMMVWALHQDGDGSPLLGALNNCYGA